jgi:hypothetical protein
MPRFNEMKFGFGRKYYDCNIDMIPNHYLEWFYENCLDVDETLRKQVQNELNKRTREGILIEEEEGTFKTEDNLYE